MSHIPLLFHAIFETPASILFLLRPSATLTVPQPAAHAVIRQYGLLLLVTNIVALAVARIAYTEGDDYLIGGLVRGVSGALSLYHVGPICRGAATIARGGRDYRGGDGFAWAYVVVLGHFSVGGWLLLNTLVEL